MSAEEILDMYESYWFKQTIFSIKKTPILGETTTTTTTTTFMEDPKEAKAPNFSHAPTLHVRSFSDQVLSAGFGFDLSSETLSPNSVLSNPKLQTILSGKEVEEFTGEEVKQVEVKQEKEEEEEATAIHSRNRTIRRGRTKKGSHTSRSLSDLEFEELKGFMDLGFVFSEQDKDSDLVSIIPGLQRLGKQPGTETEKEETRDLCESETSRSKLITKSNVSRPYLSEAWDVLDLKKKYDPLLNWRIPALGNEMAMKDHLKFWAHTVASTVR